MDDSRFLHSEETPAGGVATEDGGTVMTAAQQQITLPKNIVKVPSKVGLGNYVAEEVAGHPQEVGPTVTVDPADHKQVAHEASTEALDEEQSESTTVLDPADDAFTDLRQLEGFRERTGQESAAVTDASLADAGSALGGGTGQEFLPFAGIAAKVATTVLPALASKAAPILVKKLKHRLPSSAIKVLHAATKGSGVLSTVAKLFESAELQPVATESGMEMLVDDNFVEEVAQTIEVIIGTDDRVRITATQLIPWRRICALRITFPTGAAYRGTGFFIGPRAVATAGHCVFIRSQGGWARRVEVIPGCNGPQRPFGQVTATSFRSVSGWVNQGKPETDYGCIVLPKGSFGGNFGAFGFAALSAVAIQSTNAVLAGYPGDKPFGEMWGMGRRIKTVTAQQLIYDIDTMGGQSGAPVYVMLGGNRYVVGIHNYGAATGNSATRVIPAVYANLNTWRQIV